MAVLSFAAAEEKLALLFPDFELGEANLEGLTLTPATDATRASRQMLAATGGLLTEDPDAYDDYSDVDNQAEPAPSVLRPLVDFSGGFDIPTPSLAPARESAALVDGEL